LPDFQNSLTKKLESSKSFHKKTETKEREIMTAMGADATVDEEMDEDQRRQKQQQLRDQNIDSQFLAYNEAEISRRHEHVLAIERDALEIFEMYKDLKALVNEQQGSIDIIDNNIQDAKAKTEQAHQELLQAEEYQKKARTKKCCIVFILLGVVAAIVLASWLGPN